MHASPRKMSGRSALRRSPLARGLALLVSAGLALLGGELAVRLFFGEEIDTGFLRAENQKLHLGNLIEPSAHPELLYTLRRGLAEEWVGVIVSTSPDAPVRVSAFAPAPARPALRIALLGDSGSFGWRMDYELSYAEMLRVKLEKTLGAAIELRNYSVPGYNTLQERALFESEVAPWHPDLVILHYDHNDPDPQTAAPPSYIPPEYGDNFLRSALVKFAARRLRVARNRGSRLFSDESGATDSVIYRDWRCAGPLFDAHLAELRRLGDLLAQMEIPAVAAVAGCKLERADRPLESDHYKLLHEPVTRALAEAGFRVCDLFLDYHALLQERGWSDTLPLSVSAGDGHHGSEGHRLAADRLHDFIASDADLRARLADAAESSGAPPLDAEGNATAAAYQQALLLLARDRWADAEPLLLAAVARRPDVPGAQFNFALALMNQQKTEEAVAALETAVRLKPDYFLARLNLGRLHVLSRRPREAIVQYDAVRSAKTYADYRTHAEAGLGDAHALLAETLASSGNAAEAADHARQAIAHYRTAGRHDDAARVQKALAAFQSR